MAIQGTPYSVCETACFVVVIFPTVTDQNRVRVGILKGSRYYLWKELEMIN